MAVSGIEGTRDVGARRLSPRIKDFLLAPPSIAKEPRGRRREFRARSDRRDAVLKGDPAGLVPLTLSRPDSTLATRH